MGDNDNTQFEMTREYIQKSDANTIDITNNYESYQKYFKMGGTVRKMSVNTAKRYQDLVKKRVEEKELKSDKQVEIVVEE